MSIETIATKFIAKNAKTLYEASKTGKQLVTKTNFNKIATKSLIQPQNSAVRKTIMGADKLLKTGLKLQGEVPVDEFLKRIPAAQRKAVTELLGNPETVQFTAKHNKKGGFSILGFLAKKGNKTVGKGALSVTNFGEQNAVMKYRVSTGVRGKNLQANGFVDCAQTATPQDISIVPSFIKKMLGVDAKLGKAAGSHIQVSPTKAAKLLPEGKLNNIMNRNTTANQGMIDKVLDTARRTIGNLY